MKEMRPETNQRVCLRLLVTKMRTKDRETGDREVRQRRGNRREERGKRKREDTERERDDGSQKQSKA
jgi:hypothetical protein